MRFRFLLILLFSFLVSPLYAASFDCNKATTETEKAICADPELSALDELMFFGYKQALRSNDWKRSEEEKDDGDLINSQRSAIETQIKCGADIKCLGDFYELRIVIIRTSFPPLS